MISCIKFILYIQQNTMSTQIPQQRKRLAYFHHEFTFFKALKIVFLIKVSKLDIQIIPFKKEQNDKNTKDFWLKTDSGELTKEYEIIYYIINQSYEQSKQCSIKTDSQGQPTNKIVNLCDHDPLINARMNEKLFQLRYNLFPLLDEFYKYLLGHQKTTKLKYDNLSSKIKKQIGLLDAQINEQPEIYCKQTCFLNIIIASEIYLMCILVFEDKFRKSKFNLISMYEKITNLPQFIYAYGSGGTKSSSKELFPLEFEEQDQEKEIIPSEISRKVNQLIASSTPQIPRNQLLYNFFKTVFTQHESKKSYFPYFWMMFDCLGCTLVKFTDSVADIKPEMISQKMNNAKLAFDTILKANVDYGFIGAYKQQQEKKLMIQGLLCLGSKYYQQFVNGINMNVELKQFSLHKIDVNDQKQKSEVQLIWQNTSENTCYENVTVIMILDL